MSIPPTIDGASHEDFLAIAKLDRIAWLHTGEQFIPDGEHVWRVWCEHATVLVCRGTAASNPTGDIVAALVMFPTREATLFLHKIMVHPAVRGGGIGTALMRQALSQATAPVLLTVDPTNAAAVRLYTNFRFTEHQHIRGYYRPHEDRLVMMFDAGSGS